MSYQVGVSNIFELLDDETDDAPKTVKPAPVKEAKGAPAKQEHQAKKPAPTTATTKAAPHGKGEQQRSAGNKAQGRQDKSPRQERADKGGDNNKGERRPRQDVQVPSSGAASTVDGEERKQKRAYQPKNERHEKKVGGGGGGVGPGSRKRPYERKSGTGRGKEIKKGGSGKGGWGKEDEPHVEEAASEDFTEAAAEDVEPEPELSEQEKERLAKEQEEREKEAKQMTLDEYNKKKEEERVKFTLPPPRQVEEDPELKSLTKHVKNDDEEVLAVKKKEVKKTEKEEQKTDKDKFVPIAIGKVLGVQAPRRPRPERDDRRGDRRRDEGGSRPGFRGGRGGDGPRSARNDRKGGKTHSFKMDENAFPILS